jgi:general secretion pathway protein D
VIDELENIMALKLRFALLICLLVTLKASLAGAQNTSNDRYRVFLLRNITPQDAMQLLADVNIAKSSQLNDANMLLVTADQESLARASNMLKLVDSQEKYAVKVLMPAADANKMPAVGAMETELSAAMPKPLQTPQTKGKSVSIGTFLNSPGATPYKVILDTYNGSLIAVAPVSMMDKITAIAERVVYSKPQLTSTAPDVESTPANNAQNEPNAIFNSLLSSLDKAEKDLAKSQKKTAAANPQLYTGNLGTSAPGETSHVGGPDTETVKTTTSTLITADISKKKPAGKSKTVSPEPNKPDAEGSPAGQPAKQETKEDGGAVNVYEPNYVPNADETLELTLPDKLDIIQLLDLVGKYLNLNYVYDENKIKNIQVNLKIQGPIKVRELYPLVESVMKFTNLVMTRKGNLVTIVPVAEAMDIDPMLIDSQGGQVKAGDVVVTRIFQLNYIDTSNAKALLEGMKLGAVTELQNMGTIIVTGYAFRMNRIEQLLEIVDKPGKPKQFKFRQLRYTMAKTLAPKIKGLIDQLGDISAVVATSTTPAQPMPRRGERPPVVRPPPAAGTPSSAKTSIYLDADERTNRILMIGNDDELAIVDNLIDSLDVAQQDLRTLRVYEIQYVDAEEVRKKLEALGIIGASRDTTTTPGSRITARSVRGEQGQPAASPTPTPPSQTIGGNIELPTEEPQVVIIESTNSLMVNATPEQHALIASIIAYVDSETLQRAIPYEIYSLENQSPEDLAEVLQKFIQETIKDKEGKIQQTIKKTEEDIIIVPDKNTFSILVYASKKNQEWIGSLIRQLDKRRPQVLIDVMLVGINEDDSFTYDLQLVSKLPEMAAGGSMQKLPALLSPFPSNTVQEGTSYPGTSGGQGFYADSHIQALLTLMQKKGYGRVLARPKILVNDNEKGHIDTTTTIYVSRSASTVYTTATTPSGTAPISTSYTFDQFPSGIKLDITPHISEGSLLRLELQMSRSSQAPPPAGALADTPPNPKTEDNVNTVVTVPDNSTIILGGIITLNQVKNNSKVPFLGDIPIVGGLFRNINNTGNQSKLYVFVRANILRPDETVAGLEDLRKTSDRNRAAVERFEERFQEHQDWPGIKPKPVDPVHVLDAE